MSAGKRIRRRLTLNVSEPPSTNPNETWTPGARFANGWQKFSIYRHNGLADCGADAVQLAGFLAAMAAWNAHHEAVNMESTGNG